MSHNNMSMLDKFISIQIKNGVLQNDKFKKPENLTVKEKCYMSVVDNFFNGYDSVSDIQSMHEIINMCHYIVPIMIVWYINKCSPLSIKKNYELHQKIFGSSYFCVVKNGQNIMYKNILITIGQLMFFKWAFQNNIIKQITKNYEKIKEDLETKNIYYFSQYHDWSIIEYDKTSASLTRSMIY